MADLTPTLYISIEDADRELDSKILIAAAALQRGLSVVIGQQWLIANNHAAMPLGLFLFKGMNARIANAMQVISNYGHLTAASDEESLGLADKLYIQRDIDAGLAEYCDLFLAQGALHAEAIREKTGAPDKAIRTVGNPRIDLLRHPFSELYETEADALRETHGDYVLLNTNIGAVNSAFGSQEKYKEVVIRIGWMDPDNDKDNALFDSIVAFDEANMTLSRAVVAHLSKTFPDTKLIVRPHGSERMDTWEAYCADFSNVEAIRQGRHASWILGSRAVVHTCCTTGLEAEILGRAAVNFRPDAHERLLHRVFIANIANISANNAKEVGDLLSPVLTGDASVFEHGRPERLAALTPHITNITERFAYERIADIAQELLTSRGAVRSGFRWEVTDPENYLGAVRRTNYQREKINLSQPDFERAWAEMRTLADFDAPIQTRQIGDSLFLVKPA